jgi:hypothetical protein
MMLSITLKYLGGVATLYKNINFLLRYHNDVIYCLNMPLENTLLKKKKKFLHHITLHQPTPRHIGFETHACGSHIHRFYTQCVLCRVDVG